MGRSNKAPKKEATTFLESSAGSLTSGPHSGKRGHILTWRSIFCIPNCWCFTHTTRLTHRKGKGTNIYQVLVACSLLLHLRSPSGDLSPLFRVCKQLSPSMFLRSTQRRTQSECLQLLAFTQLMAMQSRCPASPCSASPRMSLGGEGGKSPGLPVALGQASRGWAAGGWILSWLTKTIRWADFRGIKCSYYPH